MRAVIVGNGTIENYEYIRSLICDDDFIICADGGANHLKAMNVTADVLIGDFDSIKPESQRAVKVIEYPTRKDFTDGELCVDYAVKNGFKDIMLVGMVGTRLDHTINNILLLFRCENGCLINEHCEIYPITDKIKINNKKGKTLSIIPLDGDMEGMTASGLEYPLNDETLYFGEARGNSNVVISQQAEITVKKGRGIVVISNGE